jgi:hypothetical protein
MLRIVSGEEGDLSGPPDTWIPVGGKPKRITREDEILEIAMGLAADRGDSSPALVQHTRCTRAEANQLVSGSIVPGDRESYLIAIRGSFTVRHRRPPFLPEVPESVETTSTYSVMTLIVDVATGAPTDSGMSNEYPDLAVVGSVVTDHPRQERS